ncbi:MAG: hypothetical protein LUF82_07475 [Clostridia bacterium]|nr:hypothetical protein [Clostridia bacterium]
MRRRTKILSLLAAAAVTCTAAFSGCSLVTTITQADMEQVIATVDITKSEDFDKDLQAYTSAVSQSEITKRDLVAYFISVGYSYVSDGSTTYGEAFEQLAEALVNNEILIQHSVMSTLQWMAEVDEEYTSVTSASAAVNWFNSYETEVEAYTALLDYQSDYISRVTGEEKVDYSLYCKYTLYKSINSSIDSYEESFLDIDDDSDSSSATLPTNVDTEVDNYYPTDENGDLDYGIYTGYSGNLISDSGEYQDDAVEGTTMYSRAYAYNQYIQVLDANYLITDDDDIRNVYELNYVQSQYLTLLRQRVVTNFYEMYELDLEEQMSANDYAYVQNRYNELYAQQSSTYDDESSYSSALSNMSSSSFILYTPEDGTFGYVYNILAQFNSTQSSQLDELATLLDNDVITQDEYYVYRNQLLKGVTTTDQRSSWFNGGIDYSFDATGYSDMTYYASGSNSSNTTLFFEDNLTNNSRYEELENYYGKYTFNGTAILNEDEETYTIILNNLDIDDLLDEFEGYIGWVLEDSGISGSVSRSDKYNSESYYSTTKFTYTDSYTSETDGVINYENFIYAMGKVNVDEGFDISDLTNINSGYYTVMSAVNELQYAYTTDTSVLSQYVGYSLAYTTEGSTGYVSEFEYAAKQAVENGVGTYVVVSTDYGWHIIYVTATLTAGETYEPDWSRVTTEGTFEYNFYELLKTSDLENASSNYQQSLVVMYYNDDCVTLYEDRYEDLTSLTTTAS